MKRILLKLLLPVLCLITALLGGRQLWNVAKEYYKDFTGSGIYSEAERKVRDYANSQGISYRAYPKALIDLLEKNPEAEPFVLEYPLRKGTSEPADLSRYDLEEGVPLFLQWDPHWGYLKYGNDVVGLTGCGPVCLSMAAYYLTGNDAMSPDRIVQFALDEGYCVPGNGSSWTLISEGGPKLGLQVQELPLDEGRIKRALAENKPVICVMGPGVFTSSGHFIVIRAEEDGSYWVNDPNSPTNSQRTWAYEEFADQIRNLWSVGI